MDTAAMPSNATNPPTRNHSPPNITINTNITAKPSLRVSLNPSPARQNPVTLVPSPTSPAKSIAGAILEGSHSALFTSCRAERYPSFGKALSPRQPALPVNDGHDRDEEYDQSQQFVLPQIDSQPAYPYAPYGGATSTTTSSSFRDWRRTSYNSQSSDTDPRLFSGTGLGIDLGCGGSGGVGNGGNQHLHGADALDFAATDQSFSITFQGESAAGGDEQYRGERWAGLQPESSELERESDVDTGGGRGGAKSHKSNKSSIRSRDYKMAPSAAQMAEFLKVEFGEGAREHKGTSGLPTPPMTASGASEAEGLVERELQPTKAVNDDQWRDTATGSHFTVVGAEEMSNDEVSSNLVCSTGDRIHSNDADRALTLEELLRESKYFIDYQPEGASENGFSFVPSREGSKSLAALCPEPILIKTPVAQVPKPGQSLYGLSHNPRLEPRRSMSAPITSRKAKLPLSFSFASSHQELPGSLHSDEGTVTSKQDAGTGESGDMMVHPAFRSEPTCCGATNKLQSKRSNAALPSSQIRLSVRQHPRSSQPRRTAKLVIPAKSDAERAAAQSAATTSSSTSTSESNEKNDHHHHHHQQDLSSATAESQTNFDDEELFRQLRACYRDAMCRTWWRRWGSARKLKWIRVTNWTNGDSETTPANSQAPEKRKTYRNFVARNSRSDRSYEKALMKHYRDPAKGRGKYAWVQWARRLSIVGAIDVDDECAPGRKDRLLPQEAGRGGLEFVEGFASVRIAIVAMVVLFLSIAALVLWVLLGPGDVFTGVGAGIESASGRVGTGALLAVFVLMLGWSAVGFWMLLSWFCA